MDLGNQYMKDIGVIGEVKIHEEMIGVYVEVKVDLKILNLEYLKMLLL